METEEETINDIREDVDYYRGRVQRGWDQVRSAADPRDLLEDTIRRHPLTSMTVAAAAGIAAGSTFLPSGRRSPLGVIVGGMMTMAYRGFFMAATPLIAQQVIEALAPKRVPERPPALPPLPRETAYSQDLEERRAAAASNLAPTGAMDEKSI